jgi:predicted nucleotidyltransferase
MAKQNNELIDAALKLQKYFRQHQDKFCIIGGLAVNAWGNPRTTQDIDISLYVGYGTEEPFIDRLLQSFKSRISGAKEFAEVSRVLLLQDSNGVPIDVALAALPIEEEMIERAKPFSVGRGNSLQIIAPNDLIAVKAFANRDRDWVDISDLVTRQDKNVDWPHIFQCVEVMCQLSDQIEPLKKIKAFHKKLNLKP